MVPNQVCLGLDEDTQAIYHVFYTILQMDKASYIKLIHWLSYYGINSIEEMVMCYSAFNPSYEVNGQLHYLDSWIYENISSTCRLYIKCVQEYDFVPDNNDWLGIKSINGIEKHGFKMNLPLPAQVKTVSPSSATQVQPKGRPQPIVGNITTVYKSATIPSSSQDS